MGIGSVIERRDSRGSPMTVGDRTITPVARSLVALWPGGGFVWSRPAALLVEGEGRMREVPIRDLNTGILWAIKVGAATLVAACIARDRRRRKADD